MGWNRQLVQGLLHSIAHVLISKHSPVFGVLTLKFLNSTFT